MWMHLRNYKAGHTCYFIIIPRLQAHAAFLLEPIPCENVSEEYDVKFNVF